MVETILRCEAKASNICPEHGQVNQNRDAVQKPTADQKRHFQQQLVAFFCQVGGFIPYPLMGSPSRGRGSASTHTHNALPLGCFFLPSGWFNPPPLDGGRGSPEGETPHLAEKYNPGLSPPRPAPPMALGRPAAWASGWAGRRPVHGPAWKGNENDAKATLPKTTPKPNVGLHNKSRVGCCTRRLA